MTLSPTKCKNMVISTLRSLEDLQPLLSNNLPLETVSCHKGFGLILWDTLKWMENTNEIFYQNVKAPSHPKGLEARWGPLYGPHLRL